MAVNGSNPDGPDCPTTVRERHALPCGRSVEDVHDELEAGRPSAHTLDCPHCTTAVTSLELLAEATRELIDDPVPPPAGLFDRILDAVRVDLTAAETLPLPPAGDGVDISTHALAAVLRYAVDSVEGLRAHRCRVEPVPGRPTAVRVCMSVSLAYANGRIDALAIARERVRAALSERIGLDLDRLDLELVDLWISPPSDPDDGAGR